MERLPRRSRRTRVASAAVGDHRVNEAVVATYLAGGNTRRIRGALQTLLKPQRPLSDAIAVAPSYFIALVRARPERGPQLLVHGGLDRSADVLVDQCAQRAGFKVMRSDRLPDTLAHGAFLRSPPWQAVC